MTDFLSYGLMQFSLQKEWKAHLVAEVIAFSLSTLIGVQIN